MNMQTISARATAAALVPEGDYAAWRQELAIFDAAEEIDTANAVAIRDALESALAEIAGLRRVLDGALLHKECALDTCHNLILDPDPEVIYCGRRDCCRGGPRD